MVQRYKILIEKPNKSCTNIEKCAKNVRVILRGEKFRIMAQAFIIVLYYLIHNRLTYEGLPKMPSSGLHKVWYSVKNYLIFTSFRY
jgi:hypothetical protein